MGLDIFNTLCADSIFDVVSMPSLQIAAADQDGDEEGSGDEADKVSKRKRKQEARLKVADLKTVSHGCGCAAWQGSRTT